MDEARAAGEWVKGRRLAAGMTQEELADRSGLSVRAISNLERGRTARPHPRSLEVLAAALGLPRAAGTEWAARLRADQARGASSPSLRQLPTAGEPWPRPHASFPATGPRLIEHGVPGRPEAGGQAVRQIARAANRRAARCLRAGLAAVLLIPVVAAVAALTASRFPDTHLQPLGPSRAAGPLAAPAPAPAGAARAPTMLGIFVSGEDNGDYSTIAGQRPNVANYYMYWGGSFPADFAGQAQSTGAIPFVEIEPWQGVTPGKPGECSYGPGFPAMTTIGANGPEISGYLGAFGSQIAAFGHPVILTFARMFNVSGQYPWSQGDCEGTTPKQWINAWETVRSDIDATARGLARFMWAPGPDSGGTSIDPTPYWPGSAQVDMVGVEGFPDTTYGYQLGTFSGLFGPVFTEIHAKTRLPIFIAETDLVHLGSTGYQSMTAFIRDMCSDGGNGLLQFQGDDALPLSGKQWSELDRALATYCGPISPAGG